MQIALVGLPLSGKTTLFNALTGQTEDTGFASGSREKHVATVKVPDGRLDQLHTLVPDARKVQTTIEYLDMAGVEQGSGKSGFDPQFLGDLRQTDALVIVIRGFENEAVPSGAGSVDAARDLQTIFDEFLLSDLAIVENRLDRLDRQMRKLKDDDLASEKQLLLQCQACLEEGQPLRSLDFGREAGKKLKGFQFLTLKPALVAINISETDIPSAADIEARFSDNNQYPKTAFVALSADIEMEIAQLSGEDARDFLDDLGIEEPVLTRMIRSSYGLLGLITFFTFGENEVRSWTAMEGTPAREAAGAIHSDMERGFIRAETVTFESLQELGSLSACRDKGTLRLEGKEYIVQDGDVITFRFNV